MANMRQLILPIACVLIYFIVHSDALAEPATQPASAGQGVLVLPFAPLGDAPAWIGQAVQQNLLTEVTRRGRNVAISTTQPAAADLQAARQAALASGASIVVYGTFQLVEPEIRLNGVAYDVNNERAIAALKATGSLRDLFNLQDILSGQLGRAIAPAIPNAEPAINPAAGQAAGTPVAPPANVPKIAPNSIAPAVTLQKPLAEAEYPWDRDQRLGLTAQRRTDDYLQGEPFPYGYGGYGYYGYGRYLPSYVPDLYPAYRYGGYRPIIIIQQPRNDPDPTPGRRYQGGPIRANPPDAPHVPDPTRRESPYSDDSRDR